MSAINYSFATPSSRLQLLILFNRYTSEPSFQSLAATLADHPLLDSLLNSLLLDNSSTVCTIGLTVIVKLLPIFAVKACEKLKMMLPRLLAILARIICWKERSVPKLAFEGVEDTDESSATGDAQASAYNEFTASSNLPLRPELGWERLELMFNAASSAPPPGILFSCLYYLFPCNLLRFLRGPSAYINDRRYESPFSISWEDVLDEDNIRSKSESLLRGRTVNARVIWGDWTKELTEPDTWANYSVSRIASECMMLDVRNTALGSKQFCADIASAAAEPSLLDSTTIFDGDTSTAPTPHPGYVELPSAKPRVSLESMITASVALKSNLDVEIEAPTAAWSSLLFPAGSNSPTKRAFDVPSEPNTYNEQLPSHIAQAISGLQREVLLLRNELNFELWLSRENVKHIGRLYQDRILSKNAEVEQQGLFNKLRHYRAEVQRLDRQLRDHREQSSSAKNKYADWNTELQNKLKEFREEKKAWVSEAASLRTAEKEAKALFAAQGQLLADAVKQVFELQTQRKETQHKVDRLRDYERQIEQHIRMQRLWDADFQKFNDRAEEFQQLRTQFKQVELHLESYQKTFEQMSEDARSHRRQNQALEARLSLLQKRCDASRRLPEAEIAAFMEEKSELAAANARLREENADLKDEMGEMRARMELMKAQIDGHKGLIAETRSMPAL
jgi:predicted  nucleic acid-binding Zn-ribbon protein